MTDLRERVARAIWESSANITSSKYEHISDDLKIMLSKRADAAISVIRADSEADALIAELVDALQWCVSYIQSPLRMSSDSDEALRRAALLEKARATIAKATV